MGRKQESFPAHLFCASAGGRRVNREILRRQKRKKRFEDADGLLSCPRPICASIVRPCLWHFSFDARERASAHQAHDSQPSQIVAISLLLPLSSFVDNTH